MQSMVVRRIVGRLFVWLVLLVSLLVAGPSIALGFNFGVNADNWDRQIDHPEYLSAFKAMGVNFIVWHISPEEVMSGQRLLDIIEFCRKNGFGYLFNTELVNYVPNVPYFQQPDGTYRWDINQNILEALKGDPLFLGVVYDEPMLMQSMNGQTYGERTILPYFIDTRDMPVPEAYEAVVSKISELSAYYRKFGKRLIFEMVFPDYAHPAARGGALPTAKLLKENYNDLMYYVYSGAARQYKQSELWACLDLWFVDRFPEQGGYTQAFHTPDDLFEALKYSYQAGFDYVYIEQMKGLVDGTFQLTDYGRKVVEFQKIRSRLNRSDWRNITPKRVIRRIPDGYWGQAYSYFFPDHPYGSHQPHPEIRKASAEWLKLLSVMSRGVIPPDANNWNAQKQPFFSQEKYRAMAGLQPFSLFDHHATAIETKPGVPFLDLVR